MSEKRTMTAVAIDGYGGLDTLQSRDMPVPGIADDEVLVRVRAAGVGIWDSMQREGTFGAEHPHFPLIVGAECAGDVEAVGASLETLHVGDAVYAYFRGDQGAYAQYVNVKAKFIALKPKNLSYEEAAAVPVDAITAHQALVDEVKLQRGETVFVAGGAGGVGTMAIQIARILGARVIASAGEANADYLVSLGVERDDVIDYTKTDVAEAVRKRTGGEGVDAALDAVGGKNVATTIAAVRDGGRLAELTGEDVPDERGITVAHVESQPSAPRLDVLRDLFESGRLQMPIARTFPLGEARDAQALVESRHVRGKVVLAVP